MSGFNEIANLLIDEVVAASLALQEHERQGEPLRIAVAQAQLALDRHMLEEQRRRMSVAQVATDVEQS